MSVFYKKSEMVIETGTSFSVWIKTTSHINIELAEGSQKRGSRGEEVEQKKKPDAVLQLLNMPSRVLTNYCRSSSTKS
jgi:hypothetical protein